MMPPAVPSRMHVTSLPSTAKAQIMKAQVMNARFALALLAGATLAASTASADSYFSLATVQGSPTLVEFDVVRSDADGVVEVYDFSRGTLGPLLGSKRIHEGVNPDVRISLTPPPARSAVAVLRIGADPVASQELEFHRSGR